MKKLILLITLITSFEALAASIKVSPFSFSFKTSQMTEVNSEFRTFCQGDMWNFPYWDTSSKMKPLPINHTKEVLPDGLVLHTLTFSKKYKRRNKMGLYRNKKCYADLSISLTDSRYTDYWGEDICKFPISNTYVTFRSKNTRRSTFDSSHVSKANLATLSIEYTEPLCEGGTRPCGAENPDVLGTSVFATKEGGNGKKKVGRGSWVKMNPSTGLPWVRNFCKE
jgi:hypothetical protein